MRLFPLANKSAILVIVSILVTSHVNSVYSVSETAAIFLLISPSPRSNGMGNTYGNSASEDPMASIINPAFLGFYSKNHNLGLAYSKTGWMPTLASNMSYSCNSLSFGYSMKNKPISFGLGYHHIFIDYGEQTITSGESPDPLGTINSWGRADMLSASLLFDCYIQASLGFSIKFIKSQLAPVGAGNKVEKVIVSGGAFDYGIAVCLPVFEIISSKIGKPIIFLPNIKPFFQPGFSYSTVNIGEKQIFMNSSHADPLPRTAYIGVNESFGIKYFKEGFNFNVIAYGRAFEANGLLFKSITYDQSQYLSTFFDVDKDLIIYNNGWELNLMDAFYFRKGHYKDEAGQERYNTNGFGMNIMQPFRIFNNLCKNKITNPIIEKLINDLDIEFQHSEYKTAIGAPLWGTKFDGVSLNLKTIF
jgi:hypothetical protein